MLAFPGNGNEDNVHFRDVERRPKHEATMMKLVTNLECFVHSQAKIKSTTRPHSQNFRETFCEIVNTRYRALALASAGTTQSQTDDTDNTIASKQFQKLTSKKIFHHRAA